MRTIDADGLKKQIMSPETWSTMGVKRHMCKIIDNAPTVEPTFGVFREMLCSECEKNCTECKEKRPQGKWIFDSEFTEFGNPYGTYKCDKCGGHSSNKYPFCFWCGSDMRTEVKE